MARYAKLFNNFTGGEISPSVLGRVDLPQYQNGCEILENFIPVPGGGAIRRPGTKLDYIQDQGLKIVPFVYSKDSSRYAYLTRDSGSDSLAIDIKDPNDFTSNTNTFDSQSAGGFTSDQEVSEIQYAQSGNLLIMVSPNHQPIAVFRTREGGSSAERFDARDWGSLNYFSLAYGIGGANGRKARVKAIPFQDPNISDITITASGTTGSITLTASDEVNWGDYIRIDGGGSSGIVAITAAASGTTATGSVQADFPVPTTSATTDWYMSAWGSPDLYGALGYPRSVAFYQNRLVFGGNEAFPDTLWISESANYDRLLTVELDQWTGASPAELQSGNAAAVAVTLASGEVNQIQWILDVGKGDMAIGTTGAEWIAFAPDPGSGFGPSNLKFERHSSFGSAYVQAISAGPTPIFVDRSGERVRTLEFTEASGKYQSINLTELADHLLEKAYTNRSNRWDYNGSTDIKQANSFAELAYDSTFQCIWVRSIFGDLFSCQYSRAQGTAAWAKQILGGTYDGTEPPRIQGLAVLPRKVTSLQPFPADVIFLLCQRQLSASITKTTAEYIDTPFNRPNIDFERDDLTETGSLFSDIPNYLDMATYINSGTAATDTFAIGQGADAWDIQDDA